MYKRVITLKMARQMCCELFGYRICWQTLRPTTSDTMEFEWCLEQIDTNTGWVISRICSSKNYPICLAGDIKSGIWTGKERQ
jgi:hypothetical protein